jgi:magnesium transporter
MGKSVLKRIKRAYTVIERSPQAELGLHPVVKSKRKRGSWLWMRFDVEGNSEVLECDKQTIMKRVSIPKRDLRILGPLFSQSSNILAREKAMVVNLEFIKAIVTAEEVFVLDPLNQAVLPFVDQLRQQLPLKSPSAIQESHHTDQRERHGTSAETSPGEWLLDPEAAEGLQLELPFEFRVLEIALEVSCNYMDSDVAELEREAYPALDKLAKNVSTKNLENVRSLKRNLTCLLARVQKVRDELENLLNNDRDMAELYLTRKYLQSQLLEASITSRRQSALAITTSSSRINSHRFSIATIITNVSADENDVEDLEMLLEAYFIQIDGTRNKILSIREYIEDTEDYVNIQLDSRRNAIIQLQLTVTIFYFIVALLMYIEGMLGMNIQISIYSVNGLFLPVVGSLVTGSLLLFFAMLGYARWKGLLGT